MQDASVLQLRRSGPTVGYSIQPITTVAAAGARQADFTPFGARNRSTDHAPGARDKNDHSQVTASAASVITLTTESGSDASGVWSVSRE